MPSLQTIGASLYQQEAGTGPTHIVFLHGLGGSSNYWQRVAQHLDLGQFTIHLVDLLGFGRSPWPPVAYAVDDHLDALEGWRRIALGDSETAVVGHSLGAIIAAEWADRCPIITRLVLVSYPVIRDSQAARRRLEGLSMMNRLTLGSPPLAHAVCAVMCHSRPLWRLVAPLLAQEVPADVARDAVLHTEASFFGTLEHTILAQRGGSHTSVQPALYVHGSADPLTPLTDLRAFVASRRDGELALVPNAGHDLPLTHPTELAALIDAFLRGSGTKGAPPASRPG